MTDNELVKERVWSQFSGSLIRVVINIMIGWGSDEPFEKSIIIPKNMTSDEFMVAVNSCLEMKELPKELIPTALSYLPYYLEKKPYDKDSPYLSIN